jgi:hypothetical protein
MSTPKKIAFGCEARVGKDTACNFLANALPGTTRSLRFSEPLYDILYHAQDTLGIPRQKDRRFLQWIGTEWGRSIDPDIWCKTLLAKVDDPSINYLVSDLRFPNELEALKKAGFTCVRIQRSNKPTLEGDAASHPSETALLDHPGWDLVLDNNGSLAEFQKRVLRLAL